jgi:DNA-binding CsgD family transcriptional regulator
MPRQLALNILEFSTKTATIRTPEELLSRLQELVGPYDLNVLAAAVLPLDAAQLQFENWIDGRNLFFGEAIPDAYWRQNQVAHAELGWDAIAIKGQHATASFTFAEAKRDKIPRGSWIFDFLKSFDIADGYFCPFRQWNVLYASPKYLALSPAMRSLLDSAAYITASRMSTLAETEVRERGVQLTAREIEVLQARVCFHANPVIAEYLNIKSKTVDELLRRARLKLGAPNIEVALLRAYKLGLITC